MKAIEICILPMLASVTLAACATEGPKLTFPTCVEEESDSSDGGESETGTHCNGNDVVDCFAVCGEPSDRYTTCEACDGKDLGGQTCESLGYAGGALACNGCMLDTSGCGLTVEMIDIPSGTFTMGGVDEDGTIQVNAQDNELPAREVYVSGFLIDETEVIVGEYKRCVEDGTCREPTTGSGCNYGIEGRALHPMNCVDWIEANSYCSWVAGGTKRLPTEAEWEKAARGPDPLIYPWGNAPTSCDRLVMPGCGHNSTEPVGSKPSGASPYGVLDMSGNVWEWVSDYYDPDYYEQPNNTEDPRGPSAGSGKVFRGGGWQQFDEVYFRASDRADNESTHRTVELGFRCVQDMH